APQVRVRPRVAVRLVAGVGDLADERGVIADGLAHEEEVRAPVGAGHFANEAADLFGVALAVGADGEEFGGHLAVKRRVAARVRRAEGGNRPARSWRAQAGNARGDEGNKLLRE